MKYSVVALLVLSSAAGWAQAERSERAMRRPYDDGVYLTVNNKPFFGRTPKMRTWVEGWALTGTRPDAYEVRCDSIFSDCAIPILRTRAFAGEPYGTGSLTHSESAVPWRGQRVELRADVKAGNIDGWAGLWMRVDDADGNALAFDNMQNRAMRGTTAFQWYAVVLDVPPNAARLSFGVLLHGPGAVFVRELTFEGVNEKAAPTTDLVAPLRAQASASPSTDQVSGGGGGGGEH